MNYVQPMIHPNGGGVKKVVSGGQTGVDRAALEAAREVGLQTGGWAPGGFLTNDGRDIELKTVFGLKEIDPAIPRQYVERSKRNVDDSDATVVFRLVRSAGSDGTIMYARCKRWGAWNPRVNCSDVHRPCLVISSVCDPSKVANDIVQFIRKYKVHTLNVAGHRGGTSGLPPNFTADVKEILRLAFGASSSGVSLCCYPT